MSIKTTFTAAILVAVSSTASMSQDSSGHNIHQTPAPAAARESPSTKAFMEANDRMHADMGSELTGNADVDFVRGMIPHHQGAIDMARIQLQYGKDLEIRKLAEDVIKAQEDEIAMMRDWLKKNGH